MMSHKEDAYHQTIEEATSWAHGLEAIAERIKRRFPRSEPRQRVSAYLRGLCSPVERKNAWQLAEEAGTALMACSTYWGAPSGRRMKCVMICALMWLNILARKRRS